MQQPRHRLRSRLDMLSLVHIASASVQRVCDALKPGAMKWDVESPRLVWPVFPISYITLMRPENHTNDHFARSFACTVNWFKWKEAVLGRFVHRFLFMFVFASATLQVIGVVVEVCYCFWCTLLTYVVSLIIVRTV